MAFWNQIGLIDGVSNTIIKVIFVYDHAIIISVMVVALVGSVLIRIFQKNRLEDNMACRNILSGHSVEIIWTALPALILQMLAIPSLRLLYFIDEVWKPEVSVKVIGHQWYWSYEYLSNINKLSTDSNLMFDSYIIPITNLDHGYYRLLDVDKRIVVPVNTEIRFIVSSRDVIHSWAVPSLGLKVDAVPGRLNQTGVLIDKCGIYYGQCSEICGEHHAFIPIVVEVINKTDYVVWLNKINSL